MAPTGGGVSAPGTKSKGKNKTKSVRHLLAPPAATASPSPAPGSRGKRSASQSISPSGTCESPTTEASVAALVSVMGSCAPNFDTSCIGSGAGPACAPATTTTPNVDNDDPEDGEDEEEAHLSGKRYKKCTSWVWNYFTKKKEYVEVEGKQIEEIWGYCNFARCDQSFPIKSRVTVRKEIMDNYFQEKETLYAHLKTMNCRFSATMDMWTSCQNKGYMCLTIHWIDDSWRMQKRIIGFFNVKGRHTGAKLSETFTEVMVKWYIENRLFALTLDNASSNEVAVNDIISDLKENANGSLVCDGMFFHVRCACHILNLVARDGLKVISGTLSKVKSLVLAVKGSPLQWEELMKRATEAGLDTKRDHDLEEFLYDASEPAVVESNDLERYLLEPLLKIVDSKMVGSIVSDLEVDALTNVVAKLKIEDNNKEGEEDAEEDNEEEKDMESDPIPDIMNDADEL
ncbi:unnamed protein product [Miscanthus lutarioriparius]|uniref:Transposase n=1 Tax=Miscanthus lutarioriparius TaxID=422564 RepID=A0A811NGQ1_9POAL|nr:unnamed protein product [Miscanthus lutarioriparius]